MVQQRFCVSCGRKLCEKEHPFNIVLLLDNAPSHIQCLNDLHLNEHIDFFWPKTTAGIHISFQGPLHQQNFSMIINAVFQEESTIASFWKQFNILDAIKVIKEVWNSVKESTLKKIWQKVSTARMHSRGNKVTDAMYNTVIVVQSLHLEVDTNIQELINLQEDELTSKEMTVLKNIIKEKKAASNAPEEKVLTVKMGCRRSLICWTTQQQKLRLQNFALIVWRGSNHKHEIQQQTTDFFFKPVESKP